MSEDTACAEGAEASKTDGKHSWIGVVAFAVLFIVGIAACNGFGSDDVEDPAVNQQLAKDVCQGAVKKGLKSPASAKFSEETVTAADTNAWTVLGAVDSQNSFGAMIRNTYVCRARLDRETMRATVSSLG